MSSKSQTSTQQVAIPPEVLARYNAVNARAEQIAQKPFVAYSQDPNAFVAPLSATQQAGIENINALQGMATPDVQEGQNYIRQGMAEGRDLQQQSLGTASEGQAIGSQLYGRSLGTSAAGLGAAQQIYGQALPAVQRAAATGENYAQDAAQRLYAGINQAQPFMGEAANLTRMGLGAGQQYAGMAGGYLGAGTQGVGPGQLETERYMSPYMNQVVRAQQALQAEENQAQRSALTGEAIRAGAFGGDRAGIAQANLARQQSLANQATLSNLLQQGFGQAQGVAGQQQQLGLGAEQANRAAQQFGAQQAAALGQQQFGQGLSAAQQQAALGQAIYAQNIGQGQAIAGLGQQQFGQGIGSAQAAAGMGKDIYGMSAQEAQLQQAAAQGMFGQAAQVAALQQGAGNNIFNYGLQGGQGVANLGLANQNAQLQAAQAQMGAGQIQQQTDQAGKTAMYNQFLQQQGFPYQQAQFLGNLAMGTGALSGSTTTTTSPAGWSDRRLKENIRKVGKTYDGQDIYSYRLKGEKHTQLGLMAQDVEKNNPKAVGLSQGYKTLDYEKATDKAAERGHFASGGLVPSSMGGAVGPENAYEGYARGGYAEGGTTGQWSLTGGSSYDSEMGGPDQWTNSATGEVKYGSDPTEREAAAAAAAADVSNVDPRINQFYQEFMFRDADPEGAKYWQSRLDAGASIDDVKGEISASRERNLVNQPPLTYDASKFAPTQAPVRNRYGAFAAPVGSSASSFSPAALAAAQPPAATGKGPSPQMGTGQMGGSYGQMGGGYGQPMGYGQPFGGGYGQQFGGGYGQQFGGGYGQQQMMGNFGQPQAFGKGPSVGGYGQQFGGGYGQQMGGYGGGYGGGYQQPSQMSQFAQGFMGGYQPMQQPQATGKGASPSPGYNAMSYSQPSYSAPQSGNMPTASGKGSSSPVGGFQNGGRVAKQGGGGLSLQQLAAQHMGMYGQMPGGPGFEPHSRIKHTLTMPSAEAQRNLRPGSLPQRPQGGIQSAMNAGTQFANLYKSGKGIKGDIQDFFKKDDPKKNDGGKTPQGTTTTTTQPGGAAPAAASGSSTPVATGKGPSSPEQTVDEDLSSLFAARGGRINRYAGGRTGYRAGGLPAGLAPEGGIDIPDEMPGYKLNEGLPKGGGGGGGGGGGLGSALGAVGTAVGVASTVAKILPFLAGLSDKRAKQNKEPIGELFDGQKVYRYDFGDGRTEIGLMAQDVEKRHPSAVSSMGGLKFVDYEKAVSRVKKQVGGGLGDILDLEDERRLAPEPVSEEEASLNSKRIQLAARLPAKTMSDADPIGLGAGVQMAALPSQTGLVPRERSETPREAPDSSTTPAVVASAAPPSAAPVAPATDTDTGAPKRLLRRESGGNFGALNAESGASGRAQFMPSRLEDVKRAGVIPRNMTMEQFRADKDAQISAERWHFADLNKFIDNNELGQYVGTNINGVPVTRDGIVNVGHLGGSAGMKRFLETGGRYNPADSNGTRLSDYLALGADTEGGGGKPSPVDRATQIASEASGQNWAKQGPVQKIGAKLGVPELMRDERVFVPLLAGIGSMLASDKIRFSQALGEGLAGAAGAYGAVRGQTQDIERSAAETRAIDTGTYQKSFMQTPFGNIVWLADGSYILAGEYDKLQREGKAPELLGRIPGDAEETVRKARAAKEAVTGAPAPVTPPSGSEAPSTSTPRTEGAPETPSDGTAVPPGAAPDARREGRALSAIPGVGFSDDTAKSAENERGVSISGGPAFQSAQQTSKAYVGATDATANAARDGRRYLSELASNLSDAAQGKGLDVSGFGFSGRAQAVGALNTLSAAFGGGRNFGQADSIDQINKKIETLQAAVTAAGGNQESFAALSALKNAIASPNMSPRAYSLLAADLLVQNQRAIDRQVHKERYAQKSNGFFSNASSRFDADNPETKYTQEAKAIQQLILRAPQLIKDMRAGKYTPDQIDEAFEKQFKVPGMSRYFGRGM
jgi:hypothetical protein